MFGLCMPTGETYLLLKNGKKESIAITDETSPKKYIMNDKHVLNWVKRKGYKNVDGIMYEKNNKKVIVTMAEYYAEYGKELER